MAKAAAKSIRYPTSTDRGKISVSIPRALRNDVRSLAVLYDAYVLAWAAMANVMNWPKAEAAETVLDNDGDVLLKKAGNLVARLATLSPADPGEKSDRARVLTHWAFLCGNGLDDKIIALVERRPVC